MDGTLDVLKAIATAAYKRTRDPYWKRKLDWIRSIENLSRGASSP